MRHAPWLALLVACSEAPRGGKASIDPVGGEDTGATGGGGSDGDDTAPVAPPDPAWVQIGTERHPATHVVLEAGSGGADTFSDVTLSTRGWAAIGVSGAVETADGTPRLQQLDVDLSATVDVGEWNQGRLVPPELCDDFVATWQIPGDAATDGALALAPAGEERCVVDGTQRGALLSVDFGDAATVAFSTETVTLTLRGGVAGCVLYVVNGDEVTFSRDVECSTSVTWVDGASDAAPGAARYLAPTDGPVQLVVGVVAGSDRVVGSP